MNIRQRGYALPSMVMISTALIILLLATLQSSIAINQSLTTQYFNRMARMAAEAGNVYAAACVKEGITGWTDAAPLRPNTDCNGVVGAGSPYVLENGGWNSTFSIPAIQERSDGSAIYVGTGTVNTNNNTRTYTQTIKRAINTDIFETVQSTSGQGRSCSLISNNIYCWGSNEYGQLGIGSSRPADDPGDGSDWGPYLTPQKVLKEAGVLQGKTITQVKAGDLHNCAIADGELYCWGYNNNGQLGQGTFGGYVDKPVKVGGLLAGKTVTDIGLQNRASCAIADGKIYCWGGNNNLGTLGVGAFTPSRIANPTQVVGTINNYAAQKLANASRSFGMCAIANDKAWCWGSNNGGQLGNGTTNASHTPTLVTEQSGLLAGKNVTAISMEGYDLPGNVIEAHTCVAASGQAYCWGANAEGQLGDATYTLRTLPRAVYTGGVLSGKTVTDVSAGGDASCFLADGSVYCTGSNGDGLLGVNSSTPSKTNVPVAVVKQPGILQGRTVTKLGGGSGRVCALADYLSFCWGNNYLGQIGDGTSGNTRRAPTEAIYLRPKSPSIAF